MPGNKHNDLIPINLVNYFFYFLLILLLIAYFLVSHCWYFEYYLVLILFPDVVSQDLGQIFLKHDLCRYVTGPLSGVMPSLFWISS